MLWGSCEGASETEDKVFDKHKEKDKDKDKNEIQNSAECFGGVARVHQRQKEIREEDPDALFLNAGDFYQVPIRFLHIFIFICQLSLFHFHFPTLTFPL